MSPSASRTKKVKVLVRTRPTGKFAHGQIDLRKDGKSIHIHTKRDEKHGVVNNQVQDWSFRMDGILHNCDQEAVFETTAAPMIARCLEGYNGTLLCYGQTGAGKTFTVTGATENYKHRGLIPRSLQKLYSDIEDKTDYSINIRISYLEIYNEQMFDLLSPQPFLEKSQQMTIGEDESGVYVKGLSSHLAQSEQDALNLLFEGETNRIIAQHSLNAMSSRSHCLFMVNIESRSRVMSNAVYTTSKLNFVDLAGSERLSKTLSTGKVKEEAMYINKSLTFLEQCVVALADRRRDHVPFRQSKLTHVLKDSIGGSCETTLIANIWGEIEQLEETISTLRFATRMMCVASEPVLNEQMDPTLMVNKLERDVFNLKRELAMHDTLNNRSMVSYEPLTTKQRVDIRNQVKSFISGDVEDIDIVNIRQIQGAYESFREMCQSLENDMEARLREQYTLIDKTDPDQIRDAQARGININDDGSIAGDAEGSVHGVGGTASNVKPSEVSSLSMSARRNPKPKKIKDRQSPALTKTPPAGTRTIDQGRTPSAQTEKRDAAAERAEADTLSPVTSTSPDKAPTIPRISTPPTKSQAFEDFKGGKGQQISQLTTENQEVLAEKKKKYQQLARQVNAIKTDIDKSMAKLEELKQAREAEGYTYNEDGEAVISEEEFMEIKTLKSIKASYRTNYDELKGVKSEVQYCQKIIDQCKQRLIREFDAWYTESYLLPEESNTSQHAALGARYGTSFSAGTGMEDEGEKFERLHEQLLLEDPESVSFHNARMRVDRRKTYEAAMAQAQPRKPGTPTKVNSSTAPSRLQIEST